MLDFQTWEGALSLVKQYRLLIRVTNEEEKKQLIALSGAIGCSPTNLRYRYLVYSPYGFSFGMENHSSLRGTTTTVMTFSEVLSQIETQNIHFETLDELL